MTPHNPNSSGQGDAAIRDTAARWVVRRDRGFNDDEAAEFARWLQADPRHAAAVACSSAAWGMLERVPASIALPIVNKSVRRTKPHWLPLGALAAAVAIAALLLVNPWGPEQSVRPKPAAPAKINVAADIAPQSMVLRDGTVVRLNVGAEILEQFDTAKRAVRLVRGEAHFTVTSNPARPFVVHAGEVEVRAVGTAFNVHLQSQAVDVLVTEGKVQVNPPPTAETQMPIPSPPAGGSSHFLATSPLVVAGQRAVVTLEPRSSGPRVVVSDVTQADVARVLAWHEPLLRLGGATLAELATEFERKSGKRLLLADPALGSLRVGGRFHSDDVEGFVRVLEENYGIRSERGADGTLTLHKSR